uniref:Uncharacterized protein n=1 Tax=Leersia perrieri TaxID=77586 RepID=A0A0D9X5G5_9ORYZ
MPVSYVTEQQFMMDATTGESSSQPDGFSSQPTGFPTHPAFSFPAFCSQPPPAPLAPATPAGAHSAGSISARRRRVAADPEGEGGGRLYYSNKEDLRLLNNSTDPIEGNGRKGDTY